MDPLAPLVLLGYGSLLLELLALAVPSEASTWQLLAGEPRPAAGLARVHAHPWLRKLLGYALPAGLCIVVFLIPPVVALVPGAIEWLAPVAALDHRPVEWLGVALILLGRAISIAAVLQLRHARGAGQDIAALRADGLFRWSRNPGLLGMHAFYLGNCLLFPCVALLAGFAVYSWNMHRRVRLEENHLQHAFGRRYHEYRARVPRYLLFRSRASS